MNEDNYVKSRFTLSSIPMVFGFLTQGCVIQLPSGTYIRMVNKLLYEFDMDIPIDKYDYPIYFNEDYDISEYQVYIPKVA